MPDHSRPGALRGGGGPIRRSIVNDEDLVPGRGRPQLRHDSPNTLTFIEGRHDNGDGLGSSHAYVAWRKLMMSPSCTTYSFPSSRSSPLSRHAAIVPRAIKAS